MSKILENNTILKDVVYRNEHGMGNGHISTLCPPVGTYPHKLGMEVRLIVFTAACAQVTNVVRSREFPFLVFPDFLFLALSLYPGHNPVQDEMCLSVGKRSISVPMTEMMARAPVLPMPVTSWIDCEACFFLRFHEVVSLII